MADPLHPRMVNHEVCAPEQEARERAWPRTRVRLRRAPRSWQRLGLEWAYRLLQEPRRLWRRYLVTNSAFIALTVREILKPSPPLVAHSETRTASSIAYSRRDLAEQGPLSP